MTDQDARYEVHRRITQLAPNEVASVSRWADSLIEDLTRLGITLRLNPDE